jgi:hypothetical protein
MPVGFAGMGLTGTAHNALSLLERYFFQGDDHAPPVYHGSAGEPFVL